MSYTNKAAQVQGSFANSKLFKNDHFVSRTRELILKKSSEHEIKDNRKEGNV